MSERLIDRLLSLAPRERVLIGILIIVVLPLGIWLGVLAPLAETRAASHTQLSDARALHYWVQERAVEQTSLQRANGSGPRAAIGTGGLEASLIKARLRGRVSELAETAGGKVTLRFDAVSFVALVSWLDKSDPDWGYDITGLRIEKTDTAGLVSVEAQLSPQKL